MNDSTHPKQLVAAAPNANPGGSTQRQLARQASAQHISAAQHGMLKVPYEAYINAVLAT